MILRYTFAAAHWACAILMLSALPSSAVTRICQDALITVDANDDQQAETVCAAVASAKTLLGSCGLTQRTPIHVAVVERASHPSFGECMATFDVRSDCLQITEPGRLVGLLGDGDARSQLPKDVVFSAIIVHEMAHALVHHSSSERVVSPADQEFIANAFEMASIDPEWRDRLLAADPVNPSGDVGLVNAGIYVLAPRVFANNAWRLFQRDGNGCALVQKIILGTYSFSRR